MSAEANRELIERFYAAFAECNGAAMTACYAPDAHFRDPAFGDLHGEEVGAMWRMLTGRASDLRIELHAHDAELDHALKEVDRAAQGTARTAEQVVDLLRYVIAGKLPR
jgi:ketosteroid isomerase-like protein